MHSIPASDTNPRQHAPDYLDLARLLAFEPTASSAGSFKSGLTLQSQPGSNTLLPVNGSPVWSRQPCVLLLAKNQICRVGSNHHGIETSFALGRTMPMIDAQFSDALIIESQSKQWLTSIHSNGSRSRRFRCSPQQQSEQGCASMGHEHRQRCGSFVPFPQPCQLSFVPDDRGA